MNPTVNSSVLQQMVRMRHLPEGWMRTVRITRIGASKLHSELVGLRLTEARLDAFLRKGSHSIRYEGAVITAIWPM